MVLFDSERRMARNVKKAVRMSVSLDEEAHSEICRIASDLNLSAAWIVRRAVTEFVIRQTDSSNPDLPLRPKPVKSAQ